MIIEIIDIHPEHLVDFYRWEIDRELQWQTGMEKPRSIVELMDSYDRYFFGEEPELYMKSIEVDGSIVGKLELYETTDAAYIGMIMGERRGEGIGSYALESFLQDIKAKKGIHHVHAEVYADNPGSLRFFERNGFRQTGKTEVEMFRGEERTLILVERFL
ncbi:GNAT family N-acetyltransferase [Halobacillus fulvus]|nr:GNAT family N-acetyltransferase [Halobacillus fulvus]